MADIDVDALSAEEFEALIVRINGEAAAMRLEARAVLEQAHAQAKKVREGAEREAAKIIQDALRRAREGDQR